MQFGLPANTQAVTITQPSFVRFVNCSYSPKEDITTYELAKLLPLLVNSGFVSEDIWNGMGSERRHLTRSN